MGQTKSGYKDLEIRLRQIEQDIAEAKRMERSGRGDHSFFETLVKGAPVGIARITHGGHILFVHQSMADTFGYGSPMEFTASVQNFADLYVLPGQGRNHLDLLKTENPPHEFDAKVRDAQGRSRWLRIFVRNVIERAMILAVMDMALEQPVIQFETISCSQGFELVEKLRAETS